MRGQLGALLGADPLVALGGEVAAEAPPERRQDQGQREDHHQHRDHDVLGALERARRREHDQRRTRDQRDPEAAAVEIGDAGTVPARGGPRGARRGAQDLACGRRLARGLGHRPGLAPKQGRARRGEDDGPDQRVGPPPADLAQDQKRRQRQEPDAGRHAGVGRHVRTPPGGLGGALLRDRDPGENVGDERGAEGDNRDDAEADPHQQRVDVETVGDAREDAAQVTVIGIAAERPLGRGRPVASRGVDLSAHRRSTRRAAGSSRSARPSGRRPGRS